MRRGFDSIRSTSSDSDQSDANEVEPEPFRKSEHEEIYSMKRQPSIRIELFLKTSEIGPPTKNRC